MQIKDTIPVVINDDDCDDYDYNYYDDDDNDDYDDYYYILLKGKFRGAPRHNV